MLNRLYHNVRVQIEAHANIKISKAIVHNLHLKICPRRFFTYVKLTYIISTHKIYDSQITRLNCIYICPYKRHFKHSEDLKH